MDEPSTEPQRSLGVRPGRETDLRHHDVMGGVAAVAALKLMTFNVNFANHDRPGALDTIAAADADVVLLQEITTPWKKDLAKRFAKTYPYQTFYVHPHMPAGGIAVLSKFPIKDELLIASPNADWFPGQRLVIDSGIGKLQILNVHLRPAIDDGSWLKGYITTRPMRRAEIEEYWKHLSTGMPTLVAGDFNEDTSGRAVEFLEQHSLSRVAMTADQPPTWHYKDDLLTMSIDHVMIDGSLTASDAHVIDAGGSDHRPVVVTLSAVTAAR